MHKIEKKKDNPVYFIAYGNDGLKPHYGLVDLDQEAETGKEFIEIIKDIESLKKRLLEFDVELDYYEQKLYEKHFGRKHVRRN
jgi:hypothetical protein